VCTSLEAQPWLNVFDSAGDSSRSETDKASIGEGDVNASNTATNTPSTGLANNQPQGYVQQAQVRLALDASSPLWHASQCLLPDWVAFS